MLLESIGVSMLLISAIRTSNMSDKKKIEKIFEYTGITAKGLDGDIKKCQYVRKEPIEGIGTEYIYRLPLGVPSKSLKYLNENVGVFEDGLSKKIEIEFDGGMLHVNVYEKDLPKKWDYQDVIPQLKQGSWAIPVGKTYKGYVWHDFDQIPHTVCGGTTRYGKTVNIKSIMTSLILSNPDDAEFYIIDLKRKLEFSKYEKLGQVTEVAGTPAEAREMLENLAVRMDKMMDYFLAHGYSNITETPIKRRIFVIVDEANRLVPENKNDKDKIICKAVLEDIACVAGGLGIRLIFCSQYPVGTTLPRDIKQNSDAKMCFRIQNKYASAVVLGEENGQAADLDDIRGRCMVVHGPNMFEMQVPLIKDKQMERLLQDHYVSKRKDVTSEATESTSDANPDHVIEFRDIDEDTDPDTP